MKRNTFYLYLSYSPIIERYADGVYGLRGVNVAPGVVESLIPGRHRAGTVRQDFGWTADGKIWICYRISEAMLQNGAISIPAGMKEHLEGEFVLEVEDGVSVGTVGVKGHSGWGLGPFFRRRGGEQGDYLVLSFDLKFRKAVVRIGDESLLDEISRSIDLETTQT